RDPLRGIEALDLAGDARGERRRVEIGDRADARAAVHDALPGRSQVIAEGRQDAEAGDDDATLGHGDSGRLCVLCDARRDGAPETPEAASAAPGCAFGRRIRAA